MTMRFGGVGMLARLAGLVAAGLVAMAPSGAGAQTTYYVRAITPGVSVGADGTTTMTTLVDITVATPPVANTNRAMTNNTAPTGTTRYRLRQGATTTQTNAEYFRAYTPAYGAATTIAANATAYADFYMNTTGGTSVVAKATLYEYNDTTGIVGAAKGTASFTGSTTATTRQTMNNVSFGNVAFTVPSGNRLMVVYSFDMAGNRPAFLWGQAASATPSGYQAFTVTESPAASPPAAPAAPTYTSVAQTTLTVNWTAASGATTYNVQRSPDNSTWSTLQTGIAGLTYNATGLTANTLYYFRIQAVNASGTTDGASSSVTTLPNPPAAPAAPTYASVAQTTLTVNWTAASGATTYNVQRSPDNATWTTRATGLTGLTYNETGLTANTLYYFRIQAVNTGGTTDGTSSSVTTLVNAPAAPAAPTYTVVAQTTLTVNWTSASGATSYNVQRSPDNATWTTRATGVAGLTYNETGLTANTLYYFRIQAVNAGGTTDGTSSSVTTLANPPAAPAAPTYTSVAQTTLTVNWTAASGATSYNVQRSPDNATWTTRATGVAGLTYNETGLTANTLYYFRIQAVNTGGTTDGTSSSVTTLATPPAAPAAPTYTNIAQTTLTVNWTSASGATSYNVQRSPDNATWTTRATGLAGLTYNETGLTASTLYYFRIQAVNTGGTTDGTSSSVTTLAGNAPPGTPGTPTYANIAAGGFTVNWTASPTGSTPITYTLQWSSTGSAPWTNVTGCSGAGLLTCNVSGLSSNTRYYYQVYATNAYGDATSLSSSQYTLPAAPTMSGYTNIAQNSVTVNWTSPGGPGTLTYNVQRAPDVAGSPGAFSNVAACQGISATSCNDSGLTLSTKYWYQVSATNAGGTGAFATPTSVTTASAFVGSGSMQAGTTLPVVSIVNPAPNGVVKSPFKVQARVFSPTGGGNVGTVTLYVDDVAYPTAMAASPYYGTTTTGGIWWVQVDGLATGSHTLRVRATNGTGSVWSSLFYVTVPANAGDGRLLVRDNSSQLCRDCHGSVMGHSSESTGSNYGSWAVTCRECHDPHGTKNVSLVAQQIKPPEFNVATTAKDVTFYNRAAGYTTGASVSGFANDAGTGVCQVCHTRTAYYAPLNGTSHNPGSACTNCHKHTKGLGAICTDCHGTASRNSVPATADLHQSAAPPAVAALAAVSVTGGGVHVQHVNQNTYRTDPLQCADCHTGAAHQTNHQVDIGYSALAKTAPVVVAPAEGALPGAFGTTPTCTNWCHGDGLPNAGGSVATWNWTGVGAVTCASCHGAPPPVNATGGDHPQNPACANCHGTGYATTGLTGTAKNTHINGTVEAPTGCRACHGVLQPVGTSPVADNTDVRAAPGYEAGAVDTKGNTSPLNVGVGAHQAHVNPAAHSGSPLMAAKACGVCHAVPANGNTAHADAAADWSWTAPATSQGVTPTYAAPNCTNYCHSNARPLGGSLVTTSIGWTNTSALGCTSCHGDAASGTLSTRHAKHLSGVTYVMDCTACHSSTGSRTAITGPTAHVDGAKTVTFASVGTVSQASVAYNATGFTCNTSYCHSNGTSQAFPFGTPARATLNWNTGAANADCADCHGGNSSAGVVLATGSHSAHMNQAPAYIGTNYGCVTCHNTTVSADRTLSSYANHVNGSVDVNAASWNGTTCASNYCHSSGQGAGIRYYSATWGSALANDCMRCHGAYPAGDPNYGQPSVYGEPNYANGGVGTAYANSHAKHVTGADDCNGCHMTTATFAGGAIVPGSALHTNGTRNVAFNAAVAGSATYSNDANQRCSNVSCHGSGQPQWGGQVACADCHLGSGDTDDFTSVTNGTASVLNAVQWNVAGHGKYLGTTFAGPPPGGPNNCLYCHDLAGTNHKDPAQPFRLRGALAGANDGSTVAYAAGTNNGNGVCLNCHGTGNAGVDPDTTGGSYARVTATKKINEWHAGAKHSGNPNSGQRCWDCHDPHGDANSLMIAKAVNTAPTDVYGFGGTRATTTFTLSATPVGGDYASTTVFTRVCNVCHAASGGAAHYDRNSGDGHMAQVDCTRCHAHQQGTVPAANAFAPESTATCNGCHSGPTTAPASSLIGSHARHFNAAIVPPAGYTDSGNYATQTAYAYGCASCHPKTIASHMNDTTHQGTAASPLNVELNASLLGYATGGTKTNDTTAASGLVFQSSNATCAATYCHSNGAPVGKAAAYQTATWGNAGSMTCTSCHGGAGASSTMSASHGLHINAGYGYACFRCHQPTTQAAGVIFNAAKHANTLNEVGFDAPNTSGTYATASFTCATIYCHSNGNPLGGGNAYRTPQWNAALAANCLGCHGGNNASGTPMATNKHPQHLNVAKLSVSYGCVDCHNQTVSADRTIATFANHVDTTKDVGFPLRGTMTSAAYGSPTCSSNYCHSSGRPLTTGSATAFDYKTVTWNQAAGLDCKGCHGSVPSPAFTSQFGEPNYANGGGNVVDSNSHEKHVKTNAASCTYCHSGLVNGTATAILGSSHTNGTRNVVIAATYDGNGGTVNYDSATKTCSGITCHGTSSTPVWGQTLGCASCHNTPPQGGEHSTHSAVGSWTAYNSTVNQSTAAAYGIACYTCHAGTHGNSNGLGTAAQPFNVEVTAGFGYVVGTSPFNTYQHSTGMYFRWSTTGTTCSAVYCHSNASPVNGTNAFNAVAWGQGAFGANERCVRCHKMSATATVPDTNLSHSHQLHTSPNGSSAYYYNCSQCHQGVAQGQADYPATTATILNAALHAAGTHTVAFNATMNPSPAAYNAVRYTCASTYCHSNGQALATRVYQTPAWNAATGMPADCTGCHSGNATAAVAMNSAAHGAHMNQAAAYLGTNLACGDCHGSTVASANDRAITSPAGYAVHVNGTANVMMPDGGTFNASKGCSNVYCHSTGQENLVANTADYKNPPAWNSGVTLTNDCKRCHGTEVGGIAGAPWYPNDTATIKTRNSHQKHVGGAADCVDCHDGTANALGGLLNGTTLHLNGNGDVSAGGGKKIAGTYNAVTETCSNITCHNNGTAQWGATLTCADCHWSATADVDSWNVADGTASALRISEWNAVGHGSLPVNLAQNKTGINVCLYCHDDAVVHGDKQAPVVNPFRLLGVTGASGAITDGNFNAALNNGNGVCWNCHGTGSNGVDPDGAAGTAYLLKTSTHKIDSYHYAAGGKHGAAQDGGARCWDCHDAHGDGANIMMIGSDLVRDAGDAYGLTGTRVTGVTFTANTTGTDYAGNATKVCSACHTTALHYAGATSDGHQWNAKCVACHLHDQAAVTDAFHEASTATQCSACHYSPPQTSTGHHGFHVNAATPAYGDVVPRSTQTAYAYGCGKCHTTSTANHLNYNAALPYNVDVVFDWPSAAMPYNRGASVNDVGPTGLTFRSTNGTCATYCHSNGAPVGKATVWANPTWNAAAAMTCTSCHGGADQSSTMSASHGLHINAGYAYACFRCHQPTTRAAGSIYNAAAHVNNVNNVGFDNTPAPNGAGTYNATLHCNSVYCHSNGQPLGGALTYRQPQWNATLAANCTGCHGGNQAAATGMATNKHQQHINAAANPAIGTAYGCVDCHNQTVSADRTISNYANHVDNNKDVGFPLRGAMNSAAYASPTCANNYCHSSGRPLTTGSAAAFDYKTVTWNQAATLSCTGCHGSVPTPAFTSQFGEPNYANGGANVVNSNSHEKHVRTNAASCTYCHNGLVNGTATAILGSSHTNGTRNVVIAATYDGNGATANYNASKACSGITCHGTSSTPVWGATLGCTSCHNSAPSGGAHATHTVTGQVPTAYNATASTSTTTEYGIACYTCHAGTHGNSNGQGTLAQPFNVEVTSGFGYVVGTAPLNTYAHTTGMYFRWSTTGTTCSSVYCHSNAAPLGGTQAYNAVAWNALFTGTNYRCVKCHKMSATATVPDTNLSHAHQLHTALNASGGYYYNCQECHAGVASGQSDYPTTAGSILNMALHAAGSHTLAFNATQNPFNATYPTNYNVAGVFRCNNLYCHSTGTVTTAQPSGASIPWNASVATDCTSCHPNNAASAAAMWTGSHTAHVANEGYACGVCHMATVRVQDDRTITNRTKHVNRVADVIFNASYAGGSAVFNVADNKCYSVTCHGSGAPVWGGTGVTCKDCHLSTVAADVTVYNVAFPAGTTPVIRLAEWNAAGGWGGHGVTAYGMYNATNPCLYCHDNAAGFGHKSNTNPFRLRGAALNTTNTGAFNSSATTVNAVCMNCHAASAAGFRALGGGLVDVLNTAKQVDTWHAMNTVISNGGSRCWDCHDPHGDGNLHMIGKNVTRNALDPSGWNGNRLQGIVFNTSGTGASYAVNAPNATKVCDACHTQTAYYANGGNSNGHYVDPCTNCHAHENTNPRYAFEGSGDCDACHNKQQGTRRNIVTEFKSTWSHKRSTSFYWANMTVSKWDCIVCHMEGSPADGKIFSAKHKNNVIDLRDPDTGNQIQGVNWINASGTFAGAWNSNGTEFSFNVFTRNLNSSTLEAWTKAVMVNQCLKCHDSNGAQAFIPGRALNPLNVLGYSAAKPFNTTIKVTATNTGLYNVGTWGYSALNVVGGVIDVNASFKTSNASYHPISGAQNNWYSKDQTMEAPWNAILRTGTSANTSSWGYVISCWDCHSASQKWGTQTGTVTAHGGATTVRGSTWASSSTNSNLCQICHLKVTSGHGTGSAAATINNNPTSYMGANCYYCHSSSWTKPPRPLPGEDVHGFDRFAEPLMGAGDKRWPVGPQESYKPYAFFRSVGTAGTWRTAGGGWRPRNAPGLPMGSNGQCTTTNTSPCSNSHGTYTPGGVF